MQTADSEDFQVIALLNTPESLDPFYSNETMLAETLNSFAYYGKFYIG